MLLVLGLVLGLIAVACGEGEVNVEGAGVTGTSEDVPNVPSGELAFGLQRCSSDLDWQTADPSFYRDEPIYVGNNAPVDEVRAWASQQPGYEDIWVDRNHNGWVSVGFSEDAAARQADIEAEFPGAGVVAVEVRATEQELRALRAEVEEALEGLDSWGLSHSVPSGMVSVDVPVLDEETLSRFAELAGPMLCIGGADPADAVPDGPQPTEGDGWRLLAEDLTGWSYRTGVATTPEQYEALWREADLTGELPSVDFETEIVIWFGAVYGSGCPIRLDDVAFDQDRRVVHGEFVLPGNPTFCNADANPHAFVLAVQRDRLPDAPFAVQLDAEDPPGGAPEERTTVEVDLRPTGSTATDDQLVVQFLEDMGPPQPDVLMPDLVIEDGYPWLVRLDLACSVDVLGPINGTMWRAIDPDLVNGPPEQWNQDLNDGMVAAELLMTADPPLLTVTANGHTVEYEPVPSSEEADMSCA